MRHRHNTRRIRPLTLGAVIASVAIGALAPLAVQPASATPGFPAARSATGAVRSVTDAPEPAPAPTASAAPSATDAPPAVAAPATTTAPAPSATEDSAPTSPTASVAVATGAYENTSSAIRYTGDWRGMSSGSDSGGSSSYLNSSGSASLTFSGSAVQWVSRETPSAGVAYVSLDGARVATVDRYSATTSYQRVVFQRTGLANTSHTLTIEWSGTANAASSGKNLVVDAILVPDVTAPARPTGLLAYNTGGAVGLKWNVVDTDVAGYRVYSVSPTGTRSLVGQASHSTPYFKVLAVPASTTLAYSVTAVDAAGNESGQSSKATVTTGVTPAGSYRSGRCPAATVTVRTPSELTRAVAAAKPGTVVRMAPGTYNGQMNLTAKGVAGNPVWLCGTRDAVINGTGITKGTSPIEVSFSSHFIITGMTVTNGLKGVTVRSSDHITISDMLVDSIGYEGIHLRSNTTDSVVVGNVVRKTGLLESRYGEGIYIGSSDANWCALSDCKPDRSDRNAVVDNTISRTGAELIEGKEGTTGGLIRGNMVDGTDAMSSAESWIMVSGNGWSVTGNTGTNSRMHGFRVSAHVAGWGLANLFASNTASVNAPGYGFKLYEPKGPGSTGTLVSCVDTVAGAAAGFANIPCTR